MNDMSPVTERVRVRRPRVFLRLFLILLLVAVVGGALIGFHVFKGNILKQVVKQITSTLPTVATTKAVVRPWQKHLAATGTLRASRGADLAAEVAGIVDDIHLESGTDVAAGTVLLRLRANDDDAKLAQLQAVADLDSINLQRDLKQLKAQGVAQSTVDTDEGNLRGARAQVEAQQRLMAEKIVRAPFAGRLGIRQVDVGQYLGAGTTIVTLQALDPIFIDFYLPQQALGDVRNGQAAMVSVDSYPGRPFPGTIVAINAKVDSASRMVQVRASLRNPDGALLPGMYATISIDAGAPTQRVTIPQAAVSYNPYGSLVYVVRQDGADAAGHPKFMVSQTFVTVADSRGDQAAIAKGVADGDTVVTAGQLKLRNNIQVLVDNTVQLPDAADPRPVDQ